MVILDNTELFVKEGQFAKYKNIQPIIYIDESSLARVVST